MTAKRKKIYEITVQVFDSEPHVTKKELRDAVIEGLNSFGLAAVPNSMSVRELP